MRLKKWVGIKSKQALFVHAKDLNGQMLDFILQTVASQLPILKKFDRALLITPLPGCNLH